MLYEIFFLLGKGVLKLACALYVVLYVLGQDFYGDKAEVLRLVKVFN